MAFWNGIIIEIYSRRMPDAEMICSIADYFHISVDFFLGHEGDLNRPHIIKKDVQINEI